MMIRNVFALFIKQLKDTLKNLPVLVLFIVYPCISIAMTNAMKDQTGVSVIFTAIFATMHCVFTPLIAISSFVAEEKEKNTLMALIVSKVTLKEYFFSIGGFILIADLLTGSLFLTLTKINITKAIFFMLSMAVGCLISMVGGVCIGLYAKSASAANGLAVPFGMIFSFLPMLANFNKGIEQVSRYTYGQQISYLLSEKSLSLTGLIIIILNSLILVSLSAFLYKRSRLTH